MNAIMTETAPKKNAAQTLLLVDDDPAFQQQFHEAAKKAGWDCKIARDGVEALHLLRDTRVGCIVSDVVMPRVDGMELVRLLKSDACTAETPVILISGGQVQSIIEEQGRELGAAAVLSKATGLETILERVRAAKQPAPETPTEETKNVSPLLDPSLLHTQRMKALGQMAGGVAHEFNNLLAGMAGYVELARLKYRKGESPESYLDKMVQLGDRAGRLTRQLLNFGRPAPPERTFFDFNNFIADEVQDWTALLGRRIEVKLNPSPESLPVFGDRSQLGQVLLNLCLNARDAMPKGGTLTIELRRVALSDGDCLPNSRRQPGHYAILKVCDTGTGMDERTLAQLFTPFFSTKPLGQGTGLGLTVVNSVVGYHGGWVEVSSRAGEGSCFEVYLPIQEATTQAVSSASRKL